jgi:hypothetical protein
MGKKSLIFCDLCKEETTEDSLKDLMLLSKYEICLSCFNSLEKKCKSDKVMPTAQPTKESLLSATLQDDERFFAQKKSEIEVISEDIQVTNNKPRYAQQAYTSSGECRHLNKGRVTMGSINVNGESKKGFFRRCLDCGSAVQEATKEERQGYLNSKPLGDIRESRYENK